MLLLAALFLHSGCEQEAPSDSVSGEEFSLDMLSESEMRQHDELMYELNRACDYELSEAVAYSLQTVYDE